MPAQHTINRRSVIAALGASGLGFGMATHITAAPTVDQGSSGGIMSLADHPLTGLWLAMVELASRPGTFMAVPTIFSPDGFVLLSFPVTEFIESEVKLKGAAIGTWEPVGPRKGHLTAIQVMSDTTGAYEGSLTIDAYPSVSDDGLTFEENLEESVLTVRDNRNVVINVLRHDRPRGMAARRMSPGQTGFPDGAPPLREDPRTVF